MKLPDSKKTTLAAILTFGLLGALIGILLIAMNTELLLKIVFIVMGVITIIYNIPGLAVGIMSANTRIGLASLILSAISVVIGILMIFWHAGFLMVILGVYMIVFPLLQIIFAKEKLARFKTELPKLIIGVVLLLIGPSKAIDVMFDIAGWIVLILTAVYIVAVLIGQNRADRHLHKTGSRIFVDQTGDGKVDAIYVDTTGDGKVDTSTTYRDETK